MKLKVCGMKYHDNIAEVAQLQPDYLGFIFYEKSARFFEGDIPQVQGKIQKVGVFVNASIEEMIEKVTKYNLDAIQLHGQESPEFCLNLNKSLTKQNQNQNSIQLIKVFSIKDHFDFDMLKPYESVCDFYLFDTKGKLPGGNGYTFNWNVLKNYPSTKPYFLSGGIGPDEIDNLKLFFKTKASHYCHSIDVNSKFELVPGLKNKDQLQEFKSQL